MILVLSVCFTSGVIAAMRSAAFKNSSREGRAAASLSSARSSASSERGLAVARALSQHPAYLYRVNR